MGSTGVTELFPAQSSRLQGYSSPPPTPHSASPWALEVDLPTTARGRGDGRPSETKWFPQSHVGLVRQSPQTPVPRSKFRAVPMSHLGSYDAVTRAGSRPALSNFGASEPLYMLKNYWGPQRWSAYEENVYRDSLY